MSPAQIIAVDFFPESDNTLNDLIPQDLIIATKNEKETIELNAISSIDGNLKSCIPIDNQKQLTRLKYYLEELRSTTTQDIDPEFVLREINNVIESITTKKLVERLFKLDYSETAFSEIALNVIERLSNIYIMDNKPDELFYKVEVTSDESTPNPQAA